MSTRFECDLDEPVIILAIDPGTDTLGVSVLSLDLKACELTILHGMTLNGSKSVRLTESLKDVAEAKGGRTARLESHEKALLKMLNNYNPTFVGCESPFLGRMPQAFEALVECVCTVKGAVKKYDNTLVVDMIAPTSAKKAVGVKGKGSSKDDIRNAIIEMIEDGGFGIHVHPDSVSKLIYTLDEHAIDSVAVAIYLANSLINQLDV